MSTAQMADRDTYDRIAELEYAYAACLDDDRLESWPDFFVEDCVYDITTRENVEDGYHFRPVLLP